MIRRRTFTVAAGAAALTFGLGACSKKEGKGTADNPVTLQYWLWDDRQLPSYQACADAFMKKNPAIKIKITQTAWGQYWQNLTTQIAGGSGPDVFTNQVSYYPQFVTNNQILDLSTYLKDKPVDMSQFKPGLADLYKLDDKVYGLPKDWDTMGLVYNTATATKAGYTPEKIAALEWNPKDGGSFEKFIAAMTIDKSGKTGLDAGFDKKNVATYGYYPEWGDGAIGQNGWGEFAAANGFTYAEQRVMPKKFNYDSDKLIETIDWLKGLIEKGFSPRFDKQSSLGTDATLNANKASSTVAGSFTTSTYLGKDAKQKFAYAPLPKGPAGQKSAMNGLSDAIWAGTKHPEEAFAWVRFLATAEAQDIVGKAGVVFPALNSGTEASVKTRKALGQDPTVFVEQASKQDGTFLLPIMDKGNEINAIIQDALQAAALGADTRATLTKANQDVNDLFK